MDHLPIPDHYRRNIPEVPYLGVAPRYDEKGFSGFPERHGIQTDQLLAGDFHLVEPHSPEWLESFLQEWLFFGTLHEFSKACKAPMQFGSFIQQGSAGIRTITTRALLSYARDFVQEVAASKMSEMAIQDTDQNLLRGILLQQPLRMLSIFATGSILDPASREAHVRQYTAVRDSSLLEALQTAPRCVRVARSREVEVIRLSVALSIDLLCHSLGHFTNYYLGELDESFPVSFYGWDFKEAMNQKGWCWNRVDKCLNESVDVGFITSLLPSYDSRFHELCRSGACSLQASMLNQLKFEHGAKCDGTCNDFPIDEDELVNVLVNGGNPGIAINFDDTGAISYKVVNALDYPFVAISHVWAHGLGNPKFNALPECQVRRLFNVVSKLPGLELSKFQLRGRPDVEMPVIWIDTLCVPITLKYKELAITKLREVYREASKVLVLDKHLIQVGENWLERRIQLLCSEWLTRLWTLQEGRLASSLYVQFESEAIAVTSLLQPMRAEDPMTEEDLLHSMDTSLQNQIRECFESHEKSDQHFLNLVADLGHRNTTVSSDEPICLATLLGLRLEDFGGKLSMGDIYSSFQHLPEDVIFIDGKRLEIDGYGWAPSTLLGIGTQVFRPSERSGIRTASGFRLLRNGIFLSDEFDYDNAPYNFYYVWSNHERVMWTFFGPVNLPPIADIQQPSRRLQRPAIIMQKSEDGFPLTTRGVLVSDVEYSEMDNAFMCKFQMAVKLDRWTESTASSLRIRTNVDGLAKRELWKGPFHLQGRFETQTAWCIR